MTEICRTCVTAISVWYPGLTSLPRSSGNGIRFWDWTSTMSPAVVPTSVTYWSCCRLVINVRPVHRLNFFVTTRHCDSSKLYLVYYEIYFAWLFSRVSHETYRLSKTKILATAQVRKLLVQMNNIHMSAIIHSIYQSFMSCDKSIG